MSRGKKVNSHIQRSNTTSLRYLKEIKCYQMSLEYRGPNNPKSTDEVLEMFLLAGLL